MLTKLTLIRHGITVWNKQKRYCGSKDVPLSQEGKTQAARLGKRLGAVRFDRVYTSDKRRCLETARIIFSDLPIIKTSGLREIHFGIFEGLHYQEITKKYPDIYAKWLKDPFKNNVPGAESLKAFKKRITRTLEKIVARNTGKSIAIVSHGGAISVFVSAILKNKQFWKHIPGAASLSIIEYRDNVPRIKLFNCSKHLEETHG